MISLIARTIEIFLFILMWTIILAVCLAILFLFAYTLWWFVRW